MRKRTFNKPQEAELDITSFMNLMVILIPFLLLNAVFTQINTLKVERTGNVASGSPSQSQQLTLDVYIYPDRLVVENRGVNVIATIAHTASAPDYHALNTTLRELKGNYPSVGNAMLRIAESTPYEQMIKTMDATRIVVSEQTGKVYALFPDLQVASLEGTS